MASYEEEIIKTTIDLLLHLTNPADQNPDDCNESTNEFDDILSSRLTSAKAADTFKKLAELIPTDEITTWPINNARSRSRWKFVRTNLQLMKIIHDIFVESNDEKVKLLSISQKKIVEASFEFVISLGILQNLLPGVGVPLQCRSKHIRRISAENLTEFAKYRRLCQVMDDLLYLLDVDIFHDLIVGKHLEDVLAALFQLSYAPLKKPANPEDVESVDFNLVDDDYEIKDMTFSIWKKLEGNRQNYSTQLERLLQNIYKPLLIRKLSLLLNSKNNPRWMKQKLTKFLSDILKEKNGVTVTIKALVETDSVSPGQSSHGVSIAKLIAHESSNSVHITPQLLSILQSEPKQPYEVVLIQIAALTVNSIFSDDPEFAKEKIFEEIFKPFKFLQFSTDNEICDVLRQLYNLFVIPTNNLFSVPIRTIMPSCRILFHMHCRIKDSVCYLKSNVKELLLKFICEIDEESFSTVMNSLIFNEEVGGIICMPSKKSFSLSASGGIRMVDSDEPLDMEFATVILDLIKAAPENEKIIRSLFIYLLRTFIDRSQDEKFAQKRLIIVILLTELSQCPTTLRHILKDSENIINFVGDLLRTNAESTEHDDIICVGLTFLTMVLYDVKKKKDVKWEIFVSLLPTVEKFKQHCTPEVKFLATEVCNLIATRGLIGNVETPEEVTKPLIQDVTQSDCEQYIEEACDPLLPVRAHALMELISLLKKGDPETVAKKEKVYCLFEENLKDQDSFLYLRAIEGLSCMATLKPDVVLPLLCEQFISCSTSTTQLKIGEVLVRTTKLLNDFVYPYKKLLVNTFIHGVKSKDSLIRASSLSNLAEICLMLGCNVEDMLYEVLSCALNIAQFDKDVEPRRAAILLVSGLLRGLKTYTFMVLESHLNELYGTLKRIRSTDTDQVVQVQAAGALEILNENTRQFLSSKPKLEKTIHVIRPL